MASNESVELLLPQECALAIAVSFSQMEKDRLGDQKGQNTWEFLRDRYKVVRCTQQGRFMNVEFLIRDDPNMRGGVIYFRVNLDDGSIVEKLKDS